MRNFVTILLIVFSFFMQGCSGCSQSGIRHKASSNQQPVATQRDYNANIKPVPETNHPVNRNLTRDTPRNLGELFNQSKSAVFVVYTERGDDIFQGSGFFVSSDGIAVSNYHVFKETVTGSARVITDTGNELRISRIIEFSEELDYIIFKVDTYRNHPYLKIANNTASIGDNVFAIGNPRGLNHTLSTGIVSGYRFDDKLIQTTAEITFGSSGGALLNMNGEAIGITSSGLGEANLNFAINIQALRLHRYLQ